MIRCAAIAAAILATAFFPGEGSACDDATAWQTDGGMLAPGVECGSYIVTTDGAHTHFSYGIVTYRPRVRVPFEVQVTWRRLGPEPKKTLELRVLGAMVLLKNDGFGLYAESSESRFVSDGWRPLEGYRTHDAHRVAVRQLAHRVELLVDGRSVASWAFDAPALDGNVALGFKGARGYRSRVWFKDFRVTPLRAQ